MSILSLTNYSELFVFIQGGAGSFEQETKGPAQNPSPQNIESSLEGTFIFRAAFQVVI